MKEKYPFIIHRLRFLFQHELHQSTNTYNDDGNDNRIVRNCSRAVTIHSTMIFLMLVCSCDIKENVSLQASTVTVL